MAVKKLASKSSKEESPWLWFIAGPNGAGKSTWVNSLARTKLLGSIPVLNPDLIHPQTQELKNFIDAGRQTLSAMNSHITIGKDFAIETTLSGRHYLSKAQSLKKKGWNIGCIYIGLSSVEQSIARVEERHRKGGHTVPIADIVRRYSRSMKNLTLMTTFCDYTAVFDNSFELELLLEADGEGIYIRKRSLPQWLKETYPL
jgi:predicted ABC-type ATPase